MHLSSLLATVPATTLSPPQMAASPTPTPGPHLEMRDLAPRQIGVETCGWINGEKSLALTCDVASTCAILYNSYSGHAGCCSTGTDCDIATDCLDYTDVCVTCTEDVSTRSCGPSRPYCVTNRIMYSPILTIWGCATTPLSLTVQLTYDGEIITSTPRFGEGGSRSVSRKTTSTRSRSTAAASTTESGGSGSGSENGVPVAVIAGATVGGVLGLAGLIGLIVLAVCCARRRARREGTAPPPESQGPIPEFHGPIAEFHGPMAEQGSADHKRHAPTVEQVPGDHKLAPSPLSSGATSPSASPAVGTSPQWSGHGFAGMQSMGVSEVDGYGRSSQGRPRSDAGQSELAGSFSTGRPHGS